MKTLRMKVVDRLFARMQIVYGSEFQNRWANTDVTAVKAGWAAALAWYDDHLEDISYALDNLPERCPNLVEFRNLCRKAPRAIAEQLPAPAADPERVQQAVSRLKASSAVVDHKAWAKRLMRRHCAGDRLHAMQLQCAREALQLPTDGSRDREYA